MESDTDILYKELEPDANEIMFGQRTLPDRPLTMREAAKRKKVLMKLVDQKLKFKLIEMMSQRVGAKDNNEQTVPTSSTAIPTLRQTIDSQPSHQSHNQRFASYPSESHWSNPSGFHAEGNWQQRYPTEWQPPVYPPPHYPPWTNNFGFRPNIPPNRTVNFPFSHQNLNSKKSLKRSYPENTNLVRPPFGGSKIRNDQIPQKICVDVREVPNINSASRSSLITIECMQKSQSQSKAIPPTAEISNTENSTSKTDQILEHSVSEPTNATATEKPKSRRRRRYGRNKKLRKEIRASANEVGTVAFVDGFGCHDTVTPDVPTTSTGGTGTDLWNEMSELIATVFRKETSKSEPLSSFEQKVHNKMLIEMATSPDVVRLDKDVGQFVSRVRKEELISRAKMILNQVYQSTTEVHNEFAKLKEQLIKDTKALNDRVEEVNESKKILEMHTKINEVIDSLLMPDVDAAKRKALISELVANPRILETSEIIAKPIPDAMSVMREIKRLLDEHMQVRQGKSFHIPIHQTIDIPFAATVYDRSGKISEENLKILLDALIASADSSTEARTKFAKIIDPKFSDGTLVMVCANRGTFYLVEETISSDFSGKWTGADLVVTAAQVKNPLGRSYLKTVFMKFAEPQFYHFNNLMLQLKIDNPFFLARRWALHEPPAGKSVDPTEGIFVGVDADSLGHIERQNRVATLLKSTVTFEISYDDSEKNYLPDQAFCKQ